MEKYGEAAEYFQQAAEIQQVESALNAIVSLEEVKSKSNHNEHKNVFYPKTQKRLLIVMYIWEIINQVALILYGLFAWLQNHKHKVLN